ncbi:hypothetical protein PF002_g29873 [Phytophthora fragariae]|nr:hypothetical protein PF004_g28412 [Phytophthora fragariae]KAE9171238.1 hypothetical protein PF002_g29873 [Phytophthora fragariae]
MEETVRAMNYVIEQGWAFYWGTSEWTAKEIIEACEIADRLGLIRPQHVSAHKSYTSDAANLAQTRHKRYSDAKSV